MVARTTRPRRSTGKARPRVIVGLELVSDRTIADLAQQFHLRDSRTGAFVRAADWGAYA